LTEYYLGIALLASLVAIWEWKMKYFLAGLIFPIIPVVLVAVFGIGALYFGAAKLLERMRQQFKIHATD
jgi:hypothetical protein